MVVGTVAGRLKILLFTVVLFAALGPGVPAFAQETTEETTEDTTGQERTTAQYDGQDDNDGGATARTTNTRANAASIEAASLTCERLVRLVDGGLLDGQYSEQDEIVELVEKCRLDVDSQVIAGTIPGGVLANTGGVPVLPLAGVLLLGGGIVLRTVIRR